MSSSSRHTLQLLFEGLSLALAGRNVAALRDTCIQSVISSVGLLATSFGGLHISKVRTSS